jgi:predicted AlkP superfamily pyrophosphatase or phosphodiesterase
MRKTVVINAVGLTKSLIGGSAPRLKAFMESGRSASVEPILPAVTCSVQSTYLTGKWPAEHGIVGNGWYFRDECEVKFWRQSNKLVEAPKIWEIARLKNPKFTCANICWWYNMYSMADYAVTPRPIYTADGRKIPDCYTQPADLRDELQSELGQFPLFEFWGPATSIRSSKWIASAAMRVDAMHDPTLMLIYLPHMDYCLQRVGPEHPSVGRDLAQLDEVCGKLIDYYKSKNAAIVILSEYGIGKVDQPVHLNRVLRENGMLAVRTERSGELLDAGASRAFVVADHQIAHIYVNDPADVEPVKRLIEKVPGVARVLDSEDKKQFHLDHSRAGELIALAESNSWFTYYYWLDNAKAPDFARTVDIHRKPGYDPAELFFDPNIRWPKLNIAWTLAKKSAGLRTLLEVIPTNGDLVKGSHGLLPTSDDAAPILMTDQSQLLQTDRLHATDVFQLLLDCCS